jgi:hypothetical protein
MDPYAAVVMSSAVNCWGSVVVMAGMAFGFHVKLTGAADALPAPAIVRRAVAAPTSNTVCVGFFKRNILFLLSDAERSRSIWLVHKSGYQRTANIA